MHLGVLVVFSERESDLVMAFVWKNLKFTTEKIVYCMIVFEMTQGLT